MTQQLRVYRDVNDTDMFSLVKAGEATLSRRERITEVARIHCDFIEELLGLEVANTLYEMEASAYNYITIELTAKVVTP